MQSLIKKQVKSTINHFVQFAMDERNPFKERSMSKVVTQTTRQPDRINIRIPQGIFVQFARALDGQDPIKVLTDLIVAYAVLETEHQEKGEV